MVKATALEVRLTIEITEELNERLNALAEHFNGSKSELLRRAIALIEVAVHATRKGNRLAILDENGHVETTIVGL